MEKAALNMVISYHRVMRAVQGPAGIKNPSRLMTSQEGPAGVFSTTVFVLPLRERYTHPPVTHEGQIANFSGLWLQSNFGSGLVQ